MSRKRAKPARRREKPCARAGSSESPPSRQGRSPNAGELLRRAYADFNRGDFEAVLGLMREDVDWHDTVLGGRRHGRVAVRRHWQRLFELLRFRIEPLQITEEPERVVVEVRQHVSDAEGRPLAVQMLRHAFRFEGGRISRLDAREPLPIPRAEER